MHATNWFTSLTGVTEDNYEDTQNSFTVADDGTSLTSLVNNKVLHCGKLTTPSLAELRSEFAKLESMGTGELTVSNISANARDLHYDHIAHGSTIQVASQFNLLEMAYPHITPEHGIGMYGWDHTQGPVCAIAGGAGTIYRNYLATVNGKVGQTSTNQLNMLTDVLALLDATDLVTMHNGYLMASSDALLAINNKILLTSLSELNIIRSALRVGVQWHTAVTNSTNKVTQIYCSALPVAYNHTPADLWEQFARIVLEAAYEATVYTGAINASVTGNPNVFLTLLGGGAFGNKREWILHAMWQCLMKVKTCPLHIHIVNYGGISAELQELVNNFHNAG